MGRILVYKLAWIHGIDRSGGGVKGDAQASFISTLDAGAATQSWFLGWIARSAYPPLITFLLLGWAKNIPARIRLLLIGLGSVNMFAEGVASAHRIDGTKTDFALISA